MVIQGQGSGVNGVDVETAELTSTHTVNTSTFAPVTGLSATVYTLENERVWVSAVLNANLSTSGDDVFVGYRVDGGSTVVTSVGWNNSISEEALSFAVFTDPLPAGEHTIEIMAHRGVDNDVEIYGTDTANRPSILQVARFKSGGLGAGSVAPNDVLSSTKNISSTSYEDTDMEVTFTSVASEVVNLVFVGEARRNGSAGNIYWAYSLDGGADVPLFQDTGSISGANVNSSFSIPISISSPGSHTIKLRARVDSSSFDILVDASNAPSLHVIQYRGGLIPIQHYGS
jgi:hypothetical protein